MKNRFLIVLLLAVCWKTLAFCDHTEKLSGLSKQMKILQHEIDAVDKELNKEKVKMLQTVLKANVVYLESSIIKKLKHAESKLQKQKTSLSNNSDSETIQSELKKIDATEEKIEMLNEVLLTIELWKAKL